MAELPPDGREDQNCCFERVSTAANLFLLVLPFFSGEGNVEYLRSQPVRRSGGFQQAETAATGQGEPDCSFQAHAVADGNLDMDDPNHRWKTAREE